LADKASLGRPALPRDFGGGEGMEALGQAVGGIGDIAGKLFEEEMSAQVSGSLGEATRALNDLNLEVQANPDHNARNKMYADGASKIAAEFREGLRYPRFQGLFDERLEGTLERGRMGIAQGVRQAQVDSASAKRRLYIESQVDALENISNPTERVQTLNGIREEIQAGVRGGLWSAEQAAAMQINIEDRVAGQELITESQAAADEIMATYPTAEQRMGAALSLPKGPLRDAVVSRIESRQRTEDGLTAKAAKAQHTHLLERAYVDLTQEQLLEESIRLSAAGTPLDPEVLKSAASVIAQRVNNQGPPSPYTTYSTLLKMAGDPLTRPHFLALDLNQLAGELLKGQLDKLVTNQQGGAWGFTKDTSDRVDRALAKLNLPITNTDIRKATDVDTAKAEQFRAVAENALMQAEHRKQSPLTGQEIQDTIDALFDKVVIDAWTVFPDTTVPLWQVAPETEIGDVPAADAAAIRQQLGQDLTDDEVSERYLEALLGRQAGGMQ
jgi:hypothetical protein